MPKLLNHFHLHTFLCDRAQMELEVVQNPFWNISYTVNVPNIVLCQLHLQVSSVRFRKHQHCIRKVTPNLLGMNRYFKDFIMI